MRLIERGHLTDGEWEDLIEHEYLQFNPMTEKDVRDWRMLLGLPYNRDLTEQEIKTQYELRHKNDL